MSKPRKRIYLINRDFQLRYSMAAAVVGLVSTALTATVLLFPLYQFEILRIPRFLPLPILAAMGCAALLNILLVGLLGVFITHRIAGPMYSLVRNFRRIEMGLWAGHLRIREGDDLRYVVRNFNQMVDGLVHTARTDVAEIAEVESELSRVNAEPAVVARVHALKRRFEQRLKEGPVEGHMSE
jgi:methyl-accepting chemotaxis protein